MPPNDDPNRENPYRSPHPPEREERISREAKYFSVEYEPALGAGNFDLDPSEYRASNSGRPPDEMESLRDSIAVEPALPDHADPQCFRRWLREKQSRCTMAGNLTVTLIAAVLGGPLAVIGAFMTGRSGFSGAVYVIVFGPVTEELLKQSGMIYLLEKKPYRLFAGWQFVFAAIVSGLLFATIENLIYIHLYFRVAPIQNPEAAAAFRWIACTLLHVGCATIASIGLIRVWQRQLDDGRPADLAAAFPLFAAAMILHGMYNFGAMFVKF